MVCTVWVPLDPIPLHAAVHYVAGSHLWGQFAPRHFSSGDTYADTGMPPLPADFESNRLLAWATEPGDAIAFSSLTVHGQQGGGKLRGELRRLAVRFTGDDARYCLREGEARDVVPSRFHPCSLQPGDPMRCKRFPRVWIRPDG
eukprot:gnl/TRDRNA2_/TRDRNA2_165870_c0_seq2.p2 gnl/TRDRNA2_/TRDRNA2_165870_c0~~gnl/TRDRNA2_/TRDRNA2_165870_c0_seq2.p2  ORF type:complete len:144 (-),score=10.49 gnl/TRDRNA2_/TRDRNA2_165870_c0_seq2:141-572(-)